MMGTVDGIQKKIITNISVFMSHDFSKLMQQLANEAKEGLFSTKGEAVQRRDQLIKSPTEPAPAIESLPEDSAPTDVDSEGAAVEAD